MAVVDQHQEKHAPLKDDIRLMGNILGQTIRDQVGEDVYKLIEQIRSLSKKAAKGDADAVAKLHFLLSGLHESHLVPVVRSFGHLLNLMNIAEEHHRVRRLRQAHGRSVTAIYRRSIDHLLEHLIEQGHPKQRILKTIENLKVELVLTAHPTEVTRRTISQKHDRIAVLLERRDRSVITEYGEKRLQEQLELEIASLWATDEIRHHKPTPIDEAKWGFTAVEQTLWQAVPDYLRYLDFKLRKHLGDGLSLDANPIRFASWIGGDRDGNPNVTAEITNQVCWLSRWQVAQLLYEDVDALRNELSMADCSAELRALTGDHPEPYRALLREVRNRLQRTRDYFSARLAGHQPDENDIYFEPAELRETLMLCYRSLKEQGMGKIAEGHLTDILRRLNCFGLNLLPLDLRQESSRHTEVLDAITRYVGLGSYASWSEAEKIEFLQRELAGSRPLIPAAFFEKRLSAEWLATLHQEVDYSIENIYEVLDTFRVVCQHPRSSFANYIISMAHGASDILAVMLLQREAGIVSLLPVMPLFETLDDLIRAGAVIDQLLCIESYVDKISSKQGVMIGYSDSAKDAGFLAASWAQYQAQEALLQVCTKHGVSLELFHGRGGSMSRGGGSAHDALLSQPPGAVNGKIRITEQGEMIRFKFGMSGIALRTLELYTCATVEATLVPPPSPSEQWRKEMDELTSVSLASYRQTVCDKAFLDYFHHATPEKELQRLSLGSRPAKRRAEGGVESLRAIPWVFAWTQTRLMVPAWLGTEAAIEQRIKAGQLGVIRQMIKEWPYFRSIIDMLEMVLAKALPQVSDYYEQTLLENPSSATGEELRNRLQLAVSSVLALRGAEELLLQNEVIRRSIAVRNPYVMPLHYLQAEIMCRLRKGDVDKENRAELHEHALKISIASIAAGMRNTG